ncbi:lysophospholipid acyltransferase family protein [Poseidonocella sp. HB161398]|uniref:lysophospholipid acyltransferase family protein n=1 Tax=Poseidonocella sp. HB161398 TaxID=2320855 RepID=UPI00110838B9|nr:lysophospholipid acyltransferase family protein [Poseidonocella sp. HB161398]
MAKRSPLQKRLRRLEVRIQRNPRVQRAVRNGYARYIRFVERTTRWQYLGLDAWGPEGNRDPMIFCAWHARLACTPFVGPLIGRKAKVLVSDHADGQIIAELLRAVGFEPILLQTSRSKTGSLRAALHELRAGGTLGMTPDGPMGPPERSKPGAIILAGLSGVPIVPLGYAARPAIRLPSWDRFVLPLPWGRGVMSAGPPLSIGRDELGEEAVEAACRRLDAALDAEVARCEAALKR